jgi:hypothetical protein
MKSLSIILAVTLAIATPTAALALRPGGGGGGRPGGGGGHAPAAARPGGGRTTAPTQSMRGSQPTKGTGGGRGFNMGNDVPSTRPAGGNANRNTANNGNRPNGNTNGNKNNNANGNKNNNANGNKNNNNNNNNNNGNKYNNNHPNNSTNVNNAHNNGNTYNVNRTVNANGNGYHGGYNSYGYRGAVVVNPVYHGAAWGWNRGVAWAPYPSYWGGGFWGSFAAGAATAAVMGSIVRSNQTYTSYQVAPSSPGSTLLSNYGLQQTQCGSGNLVVIYGPNNGVICAYPNDKVAAGSYAVNADTLTLQSQ